MNAPSPRPRPPLQPLQGSAWLGARLTLALRRTRRFTRWWLGFGATVVVVALLLPVAASESAATSRVALEQATADSTRVAQRRIATAQALADADTILRAARAELRRPGSRQAAPDDPRLRSLDAALRAARAQQSTAAYLALADDPAVRFGPRMQAAADSLRIASDAAEIERLGAVIVGIGQFRRNAIAAERAQAEAPAEGPLADTASLAARVRALTDSLARVDSALTAVRADVAVAADRVTDAQAALPPVSPVLLALATVGLGLLLRIGFALAREMQSPRLALVQEVERAVGAPVLAHVRDALPEGPMRFRPSGVDPFRVLYLGLTSTGTRARALIVAGADSVIVAAVSARLAIAAAADHRTTLIGELDPEQVALARVFRDHAEPGFTDALAGAFKWREVARPVGSSDGLSILMIPAGTTRDLESEAAAREDVYATFATFRDGFEFTIIAVTLRDLAEAKRLLPGAPVVVCATLGETPVASFTAEGATIQADGQKIHSVVLWDAPRPVLPSRAELAAYLSKRKGRTPGGSFKAVQEATKKPV
jgi:Mrp family chromosome partitioning ATPase